MKKVKDIMTKAPACGLPSTSLIEIAKLMRDFNIGEVPIINAEDKPVGVVTDRDIVCRTIAEGKNPLVLKAQDSMTTPCITVTPDSNLEQCVRIMEDSQIRRVPVVDSHGMVCGIVAQADIARHLGHGKTGEVVQELSKAS
jgi:CBS domain-containing protein